MQRFKVSTYTDDDRTVMLEDLERENFFVAKLPDREDRGDVEYSVIEKGQVVHQFNVPIATIKKPLLPIRLVEQIEKMYYDA